jgi:GntR family transcriptional regulator
VELPAYLQILSALRARLVRGDWGVGDRIPTDEDLMRSFAASRFTVRAAVDVLVADGIVERFRGRGTFVVARPEGAGTWMLTSFDDLVRSSFPSPPIILDAVEVTCDRPVARALGLADAAQALRIRVIRTSDALPYAYSVIHIPAPLARALPQDWRARVGQDAFVGLVAAANALAVFKAIQVSSAIAAPAAVARRLGVTPGTPLLRLERTFLAREGGAIEHATIFCRPDRYRQIIEFRSNRADAASTASASIGQEGPAHEAPHKPVPLPRPRAAAAAAVRARSPARQRRGSGGDRGGAA